MVVSEFPRGHVLQLNRKSITLGERGLPKYSAPELVVTRQGVEGDHNVYRHEVVDDDPAMAVLILPAETLAQLRAEGWPVRAGDVGENITSVGLPYDEFAPGRQYRAGEVLLEITKPCTPCDNLYLLPYVGPARGPEFLRVMLGRRGWYARVLEGGRLRVGDPIAREMPGAIGPPGRASVAPVR